MLGVTFLTIGLLGSFLQYQWHNKEIHFTQEVLAQEPEEIQVEVVINWTPERIKEEIKRTFPEEPNLAIRVARCESNLNPDAVNIHNPNGTVDRGVFQLNSVHDSRLRELGLDPFDPADNIKFARMLYDESLRRYGNGFIPWVCYTKGLV